MEVMYNGMCLFYTCVRHNECLFPLCTHADPSVDGSAQYYVVNKGSLFSWRGVTLCSFCFALLCPCPRKGISSHHFPPRGPVRLSGLNPTYSEVTLLQTEPHHQTICRKGLETKCLSPRRDVQRGRYFAFVDAAKWYVMIWYLYSSKSGNKHNNPVFVCIKSSWWVM